MLRSATAGLYVLFGACLGLSGAWTAPPATAAVLRKHIISTNPGVAPTRSRAPVQPTTRTPWVSGDGAAAGGRCGCRLEGGVGGVRSIVAPLSMAASATSTSTASSVAGLGGSRSVNWPLWYVLPIAPYQRRKTLVKEIVPGKVGYVGSFGACFVHSTRMQSWYDETLVVSFT